MASRDTSVTESAWTDPLSCPFCGDGLADGGSAFVDHVRANEACADAFERWRSNVVDDVRGEWGG